MRIIHLVLGKANPERSNGVNRAVDGLARAQRRAGAHVEVWGITPTPEAPTSAREYPLRLFPAAAQPFRLARALRLALAELAPEDCVHFHGGYHPEFHAAARALAHGGTRYVMTPHGAFRNAVVRAAWIKKRAWLALFETRLLERALAVQVFSERERDELLPYAPHAHVVVLPNGLDLGDIAAAPARSAQDRPLVFGFLGRLDAHTKGLDLLLAGFALHVAHEGPGELVIVGAGPDEERLRAEIRKAGLQSRVHLRGELFGAEKRTEFERMDVFLHTSRNEGMPMAVLEAAALGLPCVLSRETNLAECFERERAGLVLDPNTPAEIARALVQCTRFAAEHELARMGARARALVARDFDLAPLARRSLAELYAPVANSAV